MIALQNYPNSTIRSAAFIKRNWENCRLWPREALLAWLQWHIDNDRFRAVMKDGRVAGVALYRFVDVESDIRESEYRDTGGDLCYVVLCVAKAGEAMRAVYHMAMEGGIKFRTKMCWARGKYSGRNSIFNIDKLNRRFGYG